MLTASTLFDFPKSLPFADFFHPEAAPWEWLPQINKALAAFDWSQAQLPAKIPTGVSLEGQVHIDPSVKLPAYASIEGPVWIGAGTEIRPGAYIRGNVIVGEGCVLGNSCEYKNCLLLNAVQTPHYNYVGDSILGNKAHLGAGAILANLRLDQKPIRVKTPEGTIDTGLRKIGGLLGDGAEALCNAVIQPGSILGRESVVMSGMTFSGHLEPQSIAFAKQETRVIRR